MRPVLFEIGSFPVYSYGVMLFIAFTVGIIWALKEAFAHGFERDHLYEAAIIAILLALLGSRLAFVVSFWDLFRGEPWWKIFAFRDGGLIFYGGLFAALLGVVFYCRFRKISFFKLMDLTSPFIALGYAITRIGCFLNGCCYGKVTGLPWGIVIPAVDGHPRHPTQLYASAAALIIFFALRYLKKYRVFDGSVFLLFFVLYGAYRFVVEFYRVGEPFLWILSLSQVVSFLLFGFGLAIFFWQRRRVVREESLKNPLTEF